MKPSYYDKFYCIADKCEFTCCQEWKIAVDDATKEKWNLIEAKKLFGNNLSLSEKERLAGNEKLSDFVKDNDSSRVIKLCENRKCPFLNQDKLCNIVLQHGEETISETCHTFPREKHQFGDYEEKTLMLCCPYVIELLDKEEKFVLQSENDIFPKESSFSMLLSFRNKMIDYIQLDDGSDIQTKLLVIFYNLLDLYEQEDNLNAATEEFNNLLPELVNTIETMCRSDLDTLNECNELTLDLIDNYLKEGLYKSYLELISDEANDLEDILSDDSEKEEEDISVEDMHLASDELPENEKKIVEDFNVIWKKNERLISKCLAQEFYGELISEDSESDIYDSLEYMLVKFQWIVMEYVLIKHFSFLSFRKNKKLDSETIKKYMLVAFRIMGFDDDDIYEYMENSFEELVWEWGYMALLLS